MISFKFVRGFAALACLIFATAFQPAFGWTQKTNAPDTDVLRLQKGRSAVIETDASFSTLAVADEDVAEVMATSDRSFFVRGKAPGTTSILVYSADGRISELIDVDVRLSLGALQFDLDRLLPNEDIDLNAVNDGVLLSGTVSTPTAVNMAVRIAERYLPGAVSNGLSLSQSQQVLMEVRFIEASRSQIKEIGFGNQFADGRFSSTTDPSTISGLIENTVATFTGVGGENLDIQLRALENKGIVRTLAKPNLVALSGDTASFLAGGEFPVPVSSDEDTIGIEFKKFGVSLDFTPTVLGDGLVNLRVRPEVSSIDRANGIRTASIEIPGISVRRAETTIELNDGQAFAIAGLLQNDYSNDVRQTPGLGNIPVLGALFSSKRYQKSESELVIIVTPRIVTPAPHPDDLETPLNAFDVPTDSEFFLMGETAPIREQAALTH